MRAWWNSSWPWRICSTKRTSPSPLPPCGPFGHLPSGSRARRRADGNREAGHLYGVGALPPEHQLARICILAGNRTGRKLPQCAGTGPADEQRIGNFRIIPAGNAARLVIPARRRRTRQDGKIRPVEIAARANRRKRRDAKQGGYRGTLRHASPTAMDFDLPIWKGERKWQL